MRNADIEIAAHLSALRFVLEVVVANGFRTMRPAAVEAFIAEMKSRKAWHRGPMEVGEMQAIEQRSAELVAALLDAAKARADEDR